MPVDFDGAFTALKPILAQYAGRLAVKTDTAGEYTLVTKCPSPFPQHKGAPLFFGSVRLGKAYVGFHLMPIYMCPALAEHMTPGLKKRMQGKSCFNFKAAPEPELAGQLAALTKAAFERWQGQHWV